MTDIRELIKGDVFGGGAPFSPSLSMMGPVDNPEFNPEPSAAMLPVSGVQCGEVEGGSDVVGV